MLPLAAHRRNDADAGLPAGEGPQSRDLSTRGEEMKNSEQMIGRPQPAGRRVPAGGVLGTGVRDAPDRPGAAADRHRNPSRRPGGPAGGPLWGDLQRTVCARFSFAIAPASGAAGHHPGLQRQGLPYAGIPDRLLPLDPGVGHVPAVPDPVRGGEGTKIAVAAFGAALAILFSTAYGVMNARSSASLRPGSWARRGRRC